MIAETSYPVFESGQVLTSGSLNEAIEYLESLQRLSRVKLVGMGIVCGFDIAAEDGARRIRISCGTAVTSAGHLISDDEVVLDQFRPYREPVPSVTTRPDVLAPEKYQFFLDAAGDPIDMWELLPEGFVSSPGDPTPTDLSSGFLDSKVVVLFLECDLASLKNCDINDCSDKGMELSFTVRRLLIEQDAAEDMLAAEAAIQKGADRFGSDWPVHRYAHHRYELQAPRIQKLNLATHGVRTFGDLSQRILATIQDVGPRLLESMTRAWTAYRYLLADLYPQSEFPLGPFGNEGYLLRVFGEYAEEPFQAQYVYDFFHDLARSHDEFLREVWELEAECCPQPGRFPKHVLLGEPVEEPHAQGVGFVTLGEAEAFDPLAIDSGAGASDHADRFRHYFVPTELYSRGADRRDKVRSLHYRTYLLAYRFSLDGLRERPIRITPSRHGRTPLSDRAIPFHYAFDRADDLHLNWSHGDTTRARLADVFSYQITDPADHPLLDRLDGHDHYRVEGIVGKSLHDVMVELEKQRRDLGLTMAIEPVMLELATPSVLAALSLSEADEKARESLLPIHLCRIGDFEMILFILLALLFFLLVLLLQRLGTTTFNSFNMDLGQVSIEGAANLKAKRTKAEITYADMGSLYRRKLMAERQIAAHPELRTWAGPELLATFRKGTYQKDTIAQRISKGAKPDDTVGGLYSALRKEYPNLSTADAIALSSDRLEALGGEGALGRVAPAMAVMEHAEDLLELTTIRSIAEFDPQELDVRYQRLSNSLDSYVIQAEAYQDVSLTVVEAGVDDSHESIAGDAAKYGIAALIEEFRKRRDQIVGELSLPVYARRHPGMEHRAGVPVGGTLILLYAHAESYEQVWMKHESLLVQPKIEQTVQDLGAPVTVRTLDPLGSQLRDHTGSTDPLDDFVVLADFCIPHICCDSDCSDIDLAGP